MSLQLTGKVAHVLPVESGEGKNGTWQKQSFVIEYEDGKFSKKVALTVWGDKVGTVIEGQTVTVSFNAESREYNGKWYTDLKAWRIDTSGEPSVDDTTPAASAQSNPGVQNDLPF